MYNQYDGDYLLEALSDVSNWTSAVYPPPTSPVDHTFESKSIWVLH